MEILYICLAVLAGILLLAVCLVIFCPVRLMIRSDGDLRITLRVLGFKKRIFPEKEQLKFKMPKTNDPKKLLRAEKKRKKAELRLQRKEEKRLRKKNRKKQRKQAERAKEPKLNWTEQLRLILAMVKHIYDITKGKAKLKIRKLYLRISASDAAKTAIAYGLATQTVSYLLHWIDSHFMDIENEPGAVRVYADYSEKIPAADIDIQIKMPFLKGLKLVFAARSAYLDEKETSLRHAQIREAKKAEKENRT